MHKLNTVKLPLAACLVSLSCGAVTQEMEEVIIKSSLIDASSDATQTHCMLSVVNPLLPMPVKALVLALTDWWVSPQVIMAPPLANL